MIYKTKEEFEQAYIRMVQLVGIQTQANAILRRKIIELEKQIETMKFQGVS